MNPDDSPFTPNYPARIDFFTGREEQIKRLISVVRRAATGDFQVAWISGERGIGKSSLASFTGVLAERDLKALVAHVHLGSVHDLEEMVRLSYLSLAKDNQNKSWGQKLLDIFGDRVKKVGVFGVDVELRLSEEDLAATKNNFAGSLKQVIERTDSDRKMLLLILDDINGLASTPDFAHWIKSMVDGAATSRLEARVCLIFVGLQDRLDEMRRHNPSVIRSFREIVEVKPWSQAETQDFFRKAFDKKGIKLTEDGIVEILAGWSGGIPTIAHELGDHVWRAAENNKVNVIDIHKGMVGAVFSIGRRFIQPDVVQALGSKNYKSILKKIGTASINDLGTTFTREQLFSLESFTDSEKKTLNNFLQRMRKVGGVIFVERGVYRFPTLMHRMYFSLAANPPAE